MNMPAVSMNAESDSFQPTTLGELQAMSTIGCENMDDGDLGHAAIVYRGMLGELEKCVLAPTPLGSDIQASTMMVHPWGDKAIHTRGEIFVRPYAFESPTPNPEDSMMMDEDDTFIPEQDHNIMTVSAWFNLGLCYHMEWNKKKEETRLELLQQALECYQKGYQVVMNTSARLHDRDPILEVLMALAANATQASQDLGRVHQSNMWNQYLRELLRFNKADTSFAFCKNSFAMSAFLNGFARNTAQAA